MGLKPKESGVERRKLREKERETYRDYAIKGSWSAASALRTAALDLEGKCVCVRKDCGFACQCFEKQGARRDNIHNFANRKG